MPSTLGQAKHPYMVGKGCGLCDRSRQTFLREDIIQDRRPENDPGWFPAMRWAKLSWGAQQAFKHEI